MLKHHLWSEATYVKPWNPEDFQRPPPQLFNITTFENAKAQSTEQYYQIDTSDFHGPYANVRSTLDYSYHSNYHPSRQILQDHIIEHYLNDIVVTGGNSGTHCSTKAHSPWIVFTAGAMGSGKTHTLRYLHEHQYFPLESFVVVDPDDIRRHLPEWALYPPMIAGERTRKEVGYISEIMIHVALRHGKNVLVDGSLRDADWYQRHFASLRQLYPSLKIAILHVQASRENVLRRAMKRSIDTGRVVPLETLEHALECVPKSVRILAPHTDFFCEFNNDSTPSVPDIQILTPGVNWESFTRIWYQSCSITSTATTALNDARKTSISFQIDYISQVRCSPSSLPKAIVDFQQRF